MQPKPNGYYLQRQCIDACWLHCKERSEPDYMITCGENYTDWIVLLLQKQHNVHI